jgi:hypothetical protein
VHKRLEETYAKADDVVGFHLQTVWEGQQANTPDTHESIAKHFKISSPIGYDSHVDGARTSLVMQQYATGGTPWTIVIDKRGVVRFNAATPADAGQLTTLIDKLRKEPAEPSGTD